MSRDSAAASPPSDGPSPDLSSDMDTNALLRLDGLDIAEQRRENERCQDWHWGG